MVLAGYYSGSPRSYQTNWLAIIAMAHYSEAAVGNSAAQVAWPATIICWIRLGFACWIRLLDSLAGFACWIRLLDSLAGFVDWIQRRTPNLHTQTIIYHHFHHWIPPIRQGPATIIPPDYWRACY